MGTIVGDCIGATIGIHSPIPYSLGSHAARTANPALSPQTEDIAIITVRSKISLWSRLLMPEITRTCGALI